MLLEKSSTLTGGDKGKQMALLAYALIKVMTIADVKDLTINLDDVATFKAGLNGND